MRPPPYTLHVPTEMQERHPGVLVALDRLRDEMAVAMLWDDTGPGQPKAGMRPRPLVATHGVQVRVLRVLASTGALPIRWIAEAVYADVPPELRPYRPEAGAMNACSALLEKGAVVRIRKGWYAINWAGTKVQAYEEFEAWAKEKPRVLNGFTIHALMARWPDVTQPVLRKWIGRFRREHPDTTTKSEPTPSGLSHRCRYFPQP